MRRALTDAGVIVLGVVAVAAGAWYVWTLVRRRKERKAAEAIARRYQQEAR